MNIFLGDCIRQADPHVKRVTPIVGRCFHGGSQDMKIVRVSLAVSMLAMGLPMLAPSFAAQAAENVVMVGGAAMYPSKNIVENAVNSKDHTTLVAAVKAAGLVDTLMGPGPFTVFAPTNAAFGKLPAGTVDMLLKPENKAALVKVLTYHVVPGRLTAADLMRMVKDGHGTASLKTVEGDPLKLSMNGTHLFVTGEKSGIGEITISNVGQSNGVIHVVDSVLVPN
jgi:uncharacterized surface protein with fasciclin (FAS1) repeats